MDRREAFLTRLGAYVVVTVGASYALTGLTNPFRADAWFVAFLVLMPVMHVAAGVVFGRAWALLLPAIPVLAAIPGGEVIDELPLVGFLAALSPGAVLFVAIGVLGRRLAWRTDAVDVIWTAIALSLIAITVAFGAAMAEGWDPWEGTGSPDSGNAFAAAFLVALVGSAAVFAAAVRLARQRTRASSGVSEPGSTR